MTLRRQFFVGVVGGGPAGLQAAIAAASAGVDSVVVIERRRSWGEPVQCGELVSRDIERLVEVPDECVVSRIEALRWFVEGRDRGVVPFAGYVLSRPRFERHLAQRASSLGVEVLQPARVTRVQDATLEVSASDGPLVICAEYVVGADGPRSRVRRALGVRPAELAPALQATVETTWAPPEIWFHFRHATSPGYAWWIPRGATAHVGVMVEPGRRSELRRLLQEEVDRFVRAGLAVGGARLRMVSGAIPVDGPPPRTAGDRTLLCGDAAGQVDPLTGAGIENALVCGSLAGRAVAQAARGVGSAPTLYEGYWRAAIGDRLADSLRRRRALAESDSAGLADAVARAWQLDRRTRSSR